MPRNQLKHIALGIFLLCFEFTAPIENVPHRKSMVWSWPERQEINMNSGKNHASNSRISPMSVQQTQTTTPTSVNLNRFHNGNCACVPFYFCDENQVASTSEGNLIIDVRQGFPCRSVLEVCCHKPRDKLISLPSPTSIPPTNEDGDFGSSTPGIEPQCGTLNPNGVHARILGFKDSETQFGEYPWQAAILEQKMYAGEWVLKFICGASLIWPSVVISAAHCLQGRRAEHLIVRLGEWDTQTTSEFLPYQDIWGKEIVVHPLYYSGALINDIALVFLQSSVTLSAHIGSICLPAPSPHVSYDGMSCWATGWGRNTFGPGGQHQAILQEVEVAIVPEPICINLLRNTSLGRKFNFHQSYLCAGGLKGRDSCIGDGGGPLVCASLADPWRYVLAGITSWGIGCGTYGIPGVYVDVSEFISWIETEVTSRVPTFDPRKIDVDTRTFRLKNNAISILRRFPNLDKAVVLIMLQYTLIIFFVRNYQ